MEINAQTKLTDILDKYPWLPDELAKLDGRFKIIKTPVGKMMIKNATIADAVKKNGIAGGCADRGAEQADRGARLTADKKA